MTTLRPGSLRAAACRFASAHQVSLCRVASRRRIAPPPRTPRYLAEQAITRADLSSASCGPSSAHFPLIRLSTVKPVKRQPNKRSCRRPRNSDSSKVRIRGGVAFDSDVIPRR